MQRIKGIEYNILNILHKHSYRSYAQSCDFFIMSFKKCVKTMLIINVFTESERYYV